MGFEKSVGIKWSHFSKANGFRVSSDVIVECVGWGWSMEVRA